MNLRFILVLGILLNISFLTAQSKKQSNFQNNSNEISQKGPFGYIRCSSVENELALQKQFPNRLNNNEFEKWIAPLINEHQRKVASKELKTTGIITIPVVVHVIHNGDAIGTGENITDAQVRSQIKVLNEDFRKLLGSRGANNNPVGADTEIEFCLAAVDPSSNMTNGINRKQLTNESFSQTEVNTIVKPSTQWDPTKYLNIWTVRFTDNSLLGFAQFPSNSTLSGINTNGGEASTDGVVISFNAFGSADHNDGTFILNNSYKYGRTTTHEVGHWLGLRHIWGDDSGCEIDDYCNDTPVSADANYNCPASKDTCPNNPGVDMIENYMDYTRDECMNIFTQDQKTRMLTVLANSPRRKELATSSTCNSDFSFSLVSDFKEVCVPNVATYNFTYNTYFGFNQTVTFLASNLPAGVTTTFNPATATANNTNVTLTLNGISNTNLGNHQIRLTGSYGSVIKGVNVQLNIYNSIFQPINLISPANNAINIVTPRDLTWGAITNVKTYLIQIATDPLFSNIIESANVTNTNFRTKLLNPLTQYFWRVRPINPCGQGAFSSVSSFTTANIICKDFVATDIPKTILATGPNTVISTMFVNELMDLADVKVLLNISHTWASDLTISLISPKGTIIILSRENGEDHGQNYTNTIFDDFAPTSIATATTPFTGSFKPNEALNTLVNESAYGNWQLKVLDGWNEDGGSLLNWSLTLCGASKKDVDKDGIEDTVDNCPTIFNPTQSDIDKDGLGDACDDSDSDGVFDNKDNCPFIVNPNQADIDKDGIGDMCDDSDGDGILDVIDNCPFNSNINQNDNDNDGIGDVCDSDDDNDKVLDVNDNCKFGPNPDQSDVNYNGIGDVCEDCNKDGTPYYIDQFICDIAVIPGFSPNGDGLHDFFIINNIELHPNNKIQIFNRWGSKVFEAKQYKNTWDGIATEGGGNKLLPAGSYFYIIELNESEAKPVTGWIYINY